MDIGPLQKLLRLRIIESSNSSDVRALALGQQLQNGRLVAPAAACICADAGQANARASSAVATTISRAAHPDIVANVHCRSHRQSGGVHRVSLTVSLQLTLALTVNAFGSHGPGINMAGSAL